MTWQALSDRPYQEQAPQLARGVDADVEECLGDGASGIRAHVGVKGFLNDARGIATQI
jgi:hypothetical protein